MRLAVVIVTPGEDSGRQARTLISCSALLGPHQVEAWLLGGQAPEKPALPVDAVYQVIPAEPRRFYAAAEWAPALLRLYEARRPQAMLFCANLAGNELAALIGIRTGGSCMTNVSAIENREDGLHVCRAAYSSNLTASFILKKQPYVLSAAKGIFEASAGEGAPERHVITEALPEPDWRSGAALEAENGRANLETAEVIVACGRGVGSKGNMERMKNLARLMHAVPGGTRPVVLDGWLDHRDLIGSSGQTVRPKLCLAMGASGAGPFIAGVEKSEVLAAVNSDPDALIFDYCDIGVADDCSIIAEELEKILLNKR